VISSDGRRSILKKQHSNRCKFVFRGMCVHVPVFIHESAY
jgi:hypothetical protein